MTLSVQFFSLLAMIGTGIGAGVIMDMVGTAIAACDKTSVIRRRSVWLEAISWLLIGAGAFYVLILVRDGAWRMYDPVAQVSGMLLYASVFHVPFRFVGRLILAIVIRPVLFIIRLIISVVRQIIRLLANIALFFLRPLIRLQRRYRKSLQNRARVLYNKGRTITRR